MKVRIPGIKTNLESTKDTNNQAMGKKYTDLEITTLDKSLSGDITISVKQEAITGAIRNILLTSFGELVYEPTGGANLTHLLFNSNIDVIGISENVKSAIRRYEPRVEPLTVDVSQDNHGLFITITVNVTGDDTLQDLEITYRIKKLKN